MTKNKFIKWVEKGSKLRTPEGEKYVVLNSYESAFSPPPTGIFWLLSCLLLEFDDLRVGIKLVDEKPEKPNQIGIPEPKEIIETVPFGTTRIYPKSWLAPMSSLRTLKGNIKRLEKFINYEI